MVFIEHIFNPLFIPCFSVFMLFRVQVFQGPGFSESRFFRVHVFQGPAPGSGSRFQKQPNLNHLRENNKANTDSYGRGSQRVYGRRFLNKIIFLSIFTKSRSYQRCSVRKVVPKNFVKFTEKHLYQSLFFKKMAGCSLFEKYPV